MHAINDYASAIQLRSDRWSSLRETTGALARAPDGKQASGLREKVNALFDSLAILEPYWAFPGMAAFDHMRRQLEHDAFDELAFSVGRVTRALTTGAYRRRHIPLEHDSIEAEELDDEALLSPEARALTKPYFEGLEKLVKTADKQQLVHEFKLADITPKAAVFAQLLKFTVKKLFGRVEQTRRPAARAAA